MTTVYLYVKKTVQLANEVSVKLLTDGYPKKSLVLRSYVVKAIKSYEHGDYITAMAIASILDYRSHRYFNGGLALI